MYDRVMSELRPALRKESPDLDVVFPDALHVSPGWGVPADTYRERARELMGRQDVDCILAAGTQAAVALMKENNGRTPIIAIGLADPEQAGLVVDGKPVAGNLTTMIVVPNRWRGMISLFHKVIGFQRMGIMYHDSPEGRLYSNVDEAREVGRERGFSVVEYAGLNATEGQDECMTGLQQLVSEEIDAFFVTDLACFDWTVTDPLPLYEYLLDHQIPSFAREGAYQVRLGILMGGLTFNFPQLGAMHARQLVRILRGEKAEETFVKEPLALRLALNLETAKKLGVDFPEEVLIASDEIVTVSLTLQELQAFLQKKEKSAQAHFSAGAAPASPSASQ